MPVADTRDCPGHREGTLLLVRTGDTHACVSITNVPVHPQVPSHPQKLHAPHLQFITQVPQTLHTPTHTRVHPYTGVHTIYKYEYTDMCPHLYYLRTLIDPRSNANTLISTKKHVHTFVNTHECTLGQKPGTCVHTCGPRPSLGVMLDSGHQVVACRADGHPAKLGCGRPYSCHLPCQICSEEPPLCPPGGSAL